MIEEERERGGGRERGSKSDKEKGKRYRCIITNKDEGIATEEGQTVLKKKVKQHPYRQSTQCIPKQTEENKQSYRIKSLHLRLDEINIHNEFICVLLKLKP